MMYRRITSTTNRMAGALRVSALLLTILGTCGLWGCEPPASDAAPTGEDAEIANAMPIPVETLTVHSRQFTELIDVPASAEPFEEITVAAEAGGRILTAPFEEGEEIRAGGRLLRVDTELDSARIDLLEAQLESAQREYERTKNLKNKGLATPQQLDQAEDALENARLSLDQAKIGASKGGVQSPVSGVILKKHVKKGEFASPGQPIATIIQYDKLIVRAQVPESRIRYVEVGDPAQVEFPARDVTLNGEITERALAASPRTGTFAVEVTVDNADLAILPGMSARVKVVKKQWDDAIMVPREAILQGFSRSEAMVLPADSESKDRGPNSDKQVADKDEFVGAAELHVVELGPSDGPDVVITSGLADGDRLIVRGHRGLVDGALARQVRHFDSIEQMRTSGAAIDLTGSKDQPQSKKGNSQQSEGSQSETTRASEGKAQ